MDNREVLDSLTELSVQLASQADQLNRKLNMIDKLSLNLESDSARCFRPPPSYRGSRFRFHAGCGHRYHVPGHQPQPPDPLHHPRSGDQPQGLPDR